MSKNMFNNILDAMKKANAPAGGGNSDKENMWRAELDKAGNGYAIIRFLPARSDDDLPFVKLHDHGFQGPTGKWFIEKCPTTLGQACPVCEANGPLWNSGREADKEIVRKRKRRVSYIANVLVISDPKNSDNEGKVFQFKFGKKIFEKLMDAMSPPVDDKGRPIDPDEVPLNPFDLVEGANFKLKIRKVDGFSNSDKSEFEAISAVENADEIMDQVVNLNAHVDPTTFKDYDTLEAKFNQVVSSKQAPAPRARAADTDDMDDDIPFKEDKAEPVKPKAKPASKPVKEEAAGEDDDLSYFRKLANQSDND